MSATEASTFDELRTEGLPPAEGLKMANRYPEGEQNPVFSNLVTGDADIVGLVAYSIYKQNKHDWLVAFHRAKGRDPQDSELAAYIIGESTPRRLTTNHAIDTSPWWSPTGREMAFTSDRSGSPQVYVMDRDGGNVRRLTFDVSYTDSPAWSPRGDRIAFVSRTSAGFDIYVCSADGSRARLVVSGGSNENPRWSPDGRHLVFASNRAGPYGLFVTDLDDRPARRIDTGGQEVMSPAWSPRPAGPKTNP